MNKWIRLVGFAALMSAACENDDEPPLNNAEGDAGEMDNHPDDERERDNPDDEDANDTDSDQSLGADAAPHNPSADAGHAPAGDSGPEDPFVEDAGAQSRHDAATGDAGARPGDHDADTCDAVAERAALLGAVNTTSTGAVTVLSHMEEVQMVYIDASAGGYMLQATNPWVYVDLDGMMSLALTDVEADTSLDWDIALKRDVLRSNSADSGAGAAEVATLSKAFAEVDATDIPSAMFGVDEFIDDLCATELDATGKPITAFGTWYDYNPTNMLLTPKALTYLVRTADGSEVFKLAVDSYYSNPDGSDGVTSGRYLLRIQELTP